jgi:teichuronic acid biosynthesis glycosyltransferase TuaC
MIFAQRLSFALQERGIFPTTYKLNTSFTYYWRDLKNLRKTIRECRPDVVVAQFGSLTGFTAALLARSRSVIVFRGSDLNPWNGPPIHVWTTHILSHLAAFNARHVVCVSKQLRNKLWWRRARVDILPTGVDEELFRPQEFRMARQVLGWDRNERIVLFNCSKRAGKRLDRATDSVLIAERLLGQAVRLEVLDGDTEPNLVPLLMSAANCLLLASDYEGSPTVVQEAMACQLPVVSVDVGDVREMLEGVHPSWVVGSGPQEIGAALAECLRQGGNTRSNGRQLIHRCSLRTIAEKMEAIYAAVHRSA